MERTKLFLYNVKIDNTYTDRKDSIVLPTNVCQITAVCANLTNGSGYLSLFNEKTNEQILNQRHIANDKKHFNKKNLPVYSTPENNNLSYVLRLIETDPEKVCRLKIYITYIEKPIAK